MLKRTVQTRDYLVARGDVDRLNELPAQWLARLLVAQLGKTGDAACLEVGGMENSDCASAPIHATEPTEELFGVVHFLGLCTQDQGYYRFAVVDYTKESQIIAAARHMVTLGEVLHCEAKVSVPVAA